MGLGDITLYLPLVKSVAARIAARLPRTVDVDDLIGAGVLGLINAASQYDKSRGVPFDKYAEIRVRGAILDELRNLDQTSRTARRRQAEIEEVVRMLATQLGRQPSEEEVAKALGMTLSQYQALTSRFQPISIYGFDDLITSLQDGRKDTSPMLLDHSATSPEALVVQKEVAGQVAKALEELTDRQRQVIIFYYFEGMNYKEIAEILEITEGRVSQLHSAAMEKLKEELAKELWC